MIEGLPALYIFMLSAFTGYEVISRVPVILHTPFCPKCTVWTCHPIGNEIHTMIDEYIGISNAMAFKLS